MPHYCCCCCQFVVKVFAHDGKSAVQDLDAHTLLGEARCCLSTIMCGVGQVQTMDLTGGKET